MSRINTLAVLFALLAVGLFAVPGDWPLRAAQASHQNPDATDVFAGDSYTRATSATGALHFRLGLVSDTTNTAGVHRSGWNGAPSTTYVLTFNRWATGTAPPVTPDGDGTDTCVGEILRDDTANVEATLFTGTTCPANGATYNFASPNLAGTMRIRVRVVQSNELLDNYNVNSDSGGVHDKGALRNGIDLTSIDHGGYPAGSTYAYTVAGEVITLTVTATPRMADQPNAALQHRFTSGDGFQACGSTTVTIAYGTSNPVTTAVFTADPIGDACPAAATAMDCRAIISGDSPLTSEPWSFFSSWPAGYEDYDGFFAGHALKRNVCLNVDARITATHLLQADNTFSTPPMSENDPDDARYANDIAYVATRFTNARGEGLNGLTFSSNLFDAPSGAIIGTTEHLRTGLTTATQGGQTGWGPLRLFNDGSPTGSWRKTVDVTAPSTIDADTHLLSATKDYTVTVPEEGGSTMGDPLKLFVSHQEANGGTTVLFVASEAFLDGTARTGNAADTDGYLYDPSGDLIQNAVATSEVHDGIYTWTYSLGAAPELGNWVAVVQTTDPDTSDPVTSANTFTVTVPDHATDHDAILQNITDHRNGTFELMNTEIAGYTGGDFLALLLFIAIFVWGGATRQLFVCIMGFVGAVLISIESPDLPTKWVILLAMLGAGILAIREHWARKKGEGKAA